MTPELRSPADPAEGDPPPDVVHLHAAHPPPAPVVPRQRPAAQGPFAGRTEEPARLDQALTAAAPHGSNPAAGPAAGATVLIFGDRPGWRWRGRTGIWSGFPAFEVTPHHIPQDLDAQAALYRSLVAGRRKLARWTTSAPASRSRC